jgi:hypothetical protein
MPRKKSYKPNLPPMTTREDRLAALEAFRPSVPPPATPSDGVAYCVRKLIERRCPDETVARSLCARLWPKMSPAETEKVVEAWLAQPIRGTYVSEL